MHLYGKVIVIKRNETDGAHFPLTATCCLFGRGLESDIRIQLPTVDATQCQIEVDEKGHVFIKSMSTTSSTLVNDKVLSNSLTALSHGDVITIVDRKFRFEFPADSRFYPHQKSPKIKSPRTPRSGRTSLTGKPESGENEFKISGQSSLVSPLSPRTDNVPSSAKSPHSAKKNVVGTPVSSSNGNVGASSNLVRRSEGSSRKATSPDFLFGLSPASFYKAAVTPRSLKNLSASEQGKSPALEISLNDLSASAKPIAFNKQRSPGSPYPKTSANLRKSITDLRRRSVPVFESEEDTTQLQKANEQVIEDVDETTIPLQAGRKRKSNSFSLLSGKRKRVSFGPNLSPEHFDKALPPKTPIKRGATPGRSDRQYRKSLLKIKPQRSKIASPNVISPSKIESPLKTPVKVPASPQTAELIVNTVNSSVENTASAKLLTPRSRPLDPSLSLRSTPTSTSGKSSPSNKKIVQIADFRDKGLPVTETNGSVPPLSVFSVSTPLSTGETVKSPKSSISGGSSSSLEKSSTPRRSRSSPVTPSTPRRSSLSPQNSSVSKRSSPQKPLTPGSRPSPQKPSTLRRSSSSPQNLSTPKISEKLSSPERSSSPRQKPSTPEGSSSSSLVSSSPQKPSTPRRSNSSPQKPSTPQRSSLSLQKFMVSSQKPSTPRSNLSPQKPLTPRSGLSPQKPSTPRRSSLSQKALTPRKSSLSPQRSFTPRRSSLSPQKSRKSSSSSQKPSTPRRSSSASKLSSKSVNHAELDVSENIDLPTSSFEKYERTPSRTTSSVKATPKSSTKFVTDVDLSLLPNSPAHSQDLFSQASPEAVVGQIISNKTHSTPKVRKARSSIMLGAKSASPFGMKRIFRTPKQKYATTAVLSPSALKRLMKTPKAKKVHLSAISLTGIKNLVKTPRIKRANHIVDSPSGLKRLLKTPKEKQVFEASPVGIKEMMNTLPAGSARLSGVSSLFSTPPTSKQVSAFADLNNSNATPLSVKHTPGLVSSEKRIRNPKKFFDDAQATNSPISRKSLTPKTPANGTIKSPKSHTPQTLKRPVGRPPSAKKMIASSIQKSPAGKIISPRSHTPQSVKRPVGRPPSAKKIIASPINKSPAGKIISPPQDFNKVVALRAIHGHAITPKLAALKAGMPKSITKPAAVSAKKTPYKKTWSDIVKSGVQKPVHARKIVEPFRGVVKKKKSPILLKRVLKTPKTPRAFARALAPTTGHADSPVTIIVGKKVLGRPKTPKPLPRKGRKESFSKASRKSAGNTSFTGLADMFKEQESVLNESALYADIPDTPDGPNEMLISPLSNHKQRLSARKSTNLIGVKELFIQNEQQEPNLTGVKELFLTSKTTHIASPSGLRRLMKTPKRMADYMSPTGIRRLLATPKTKGLPVSPTGVEMLFQTPVDFATTSSHNRESGKQQSDEVQKSQSPLTSNKSGIRGRKRKAEGSITNISPKKFCSPEQEGMHKTLSVKSPFLIQESQVQMAESPDIGKKVKLSVHNDTNTVDYDGKNASLSSPPVEAQLAKSDTAVSNKKSAFRGRRGKLQHLEPARADEIATFAAEGQIASSNIKSTSKGRIAKVQTESARADEIATFAAGGQIASSTIKSTSKGRITKVQTESAPVEVVPPTAGGKIAPSPVKTAGRGRRGKDQTIESGAVGNVAPLATAGHTAPSPVKLTGRGRRAKVQIGESAAVDEAAPFSVGGQTAPSPAKTTSRGRKGKVQTIDSAAVAGGQTAPSPVKTSGRGRRAKVQIVESAAVDEATPFSVGGQTAPSPAKTTSRGRKGKVQTIQSAAVIDDVVVGGQTAPSPAKTTSRGRKGKVQTFVSAAVVDDVTLLASGGKTAPLPAKTTGRGRRAKVQILESVAVSKVVQFTAGGKTAQSPVKTTGRGRKGKVQTFGSAEIVDDVTALASGGQIAPSPTKTTGRGRKGKVQTIQSAAVIDDVVVGGQTAPSPAKTTSRGRKGKVQPFVSAAVVDDVTLLASGGKTAPSPTKTAGRGRKVKIVESAAVDEVAPLVSGDQIAPPPVKTTGRRGKVLTFESAEVEVVPLAKTTGRGRKAKVQIESAAVVEIAPLAAGEHTASAPVKTTGRGRKGKVYVNEFTAPSPARKHSAVRDSSPVKKPVVSDEAVTDIPQQDKKSGRVKRKAEKTAVPVPTKRVKVHSPVQTSPVKPRGRTAQASAIKSSPSVTSSSRSRQGLAKKATAVVEKVALLPRSATSLTKKISPVKERRGHLKKAVTNTIETRVSQVTRKQRKSETQDILPPSASTAANSKSSKAVKTTAQQKPTVPTRRSKRQ